MSAHRVLISDGGDGQGRSALAAIRALGTCGWSPIVTVSGPWSVAGASRFCKQRIRVPAVGTDPTGYAEAVHHALNDPSILGVLPASDAALVALGAPGVGLIDKQMLAHRAAASGLDTPPSHLADHETALVDAADDIGYPVVVKPTVSRRPAALLGTPAVARKQAASLLAGDAVLVQPYLKDPLRSVAGLRWQGRLHLLVHQRYLRTWPVGCGPSSAAVTTTPDPALEAGLDRLLIGYEGLFQAQFAGSYLLDLNPRVYGSLPLAVAAGANLPVALCAAATDGSPPRGHARPGVRYRWVEGDLRSVLHQLRRSELSLSAALDALRWRRGTCHSVLSWHDPGPMLARLCYVATRRRA